MPDLIIGRCVPAPGGSQGALRDVFTFPRVRVPVAPVRFHSKLGRLAICSDCDEVFELGGLCPACASEAFVLLDSFLRPRDPNAYPLPWKTGRGPAS